MAVLQLTNVNTYYGESHILQGVNMAVPEGRAVALLGRNGMGKTTTIRSIIGFNQPKAGSIIFDGRELVGRTSHEIARLGIGLVPQGRRIFSSLTVRENLTVAAREGQANRWTIEKIGEMFPILQQRANQKAGFLSGGEQQMLAIGRALVTNPKMLLMDEPSEGLSPKMVWEVARVISNLKSEGYTILLVEQNFTMALDVADEVYILNKGRIAWHGTSNELQVNTHITGQYLGMGLHSA